MAKSSKQKATTIAPALSAPKHKDQGKKKENKKPAVVAAPPPPLDHSEDNSGEEQAVDIISEGEGEDVDDQEEDDTDEEEDSEDEGVDQEGMERLIKLLGEDGLDDFDRAQLSTLGGEENEDEDEGSDEEREEEGSDEEREEDIDRDDDEDEEEIAGSGKGDVNGYDENEEEDEAVLLDEVESIDDDAVPRQKLELDNKVALERIRQTIELDPSLPWTETLTLTYPEKIEVDVDDDLNRELAFYKQALHSAQTARALASKYNFPFTRPSDYFAEMVKSDAHMERIRQRLLNESATIKKSEEKRREREGKKFGKQVQLEKLKEREKSKKEMEERLKNLKRKRKDMLDNPQDNDSKDFDVAVEDAISDRPSKRGKSSRGDSKDSRMPRHARDKKFGFGGAGRRSKQNTKESTDNFSSNAGRAKKGKGSAGGNGGRKKRPGKSKRVAARSKS